MNKPVQTTFLHRPFTRRHALHTLAAIGAIGTLPVHLTLSANASSADIRAPKIPVPINYFGLHIHRTVVPQPWLPNGDRLTPWPEAKFGTWRLWDAYVAWPNLEPKRGGWTFATLDKYVAMANLTGVEVLLPLGLSPAWASARPGEPSSYQPGNAAEPRDMDDWRNYVRTIAKRYKGRVRIYELWNEVNLKGFYTGSAGKMVELARVAYETLKEIDPGVIVVSPSVTGEGRNTDWLDNYLALGGGQYADVIGYHFYVPKSPPEAMLPVIRLVRQIMLKHGMANKPLWNTESGWWIENKNMPQRIGAVQPYWRKLDDSESAAYVARALLLAWAGGVSRFYWYAWDNLDMGLIDPLEKIIKPAGLAYARMVSWMQGAIFFGCTEHQGRWQCDLKDAQGRQARILWRQSGGEQEWLIPLEWGAQEAEFLDGRVLGLSPGAATVMVGQAPLLVR